MAIEKNVYVDGVTIIRAEQLNAWQDELIDLANRKAGALIDTASGTIASFVPDSTIDNLLGVSVDIEPVQDLHGYDHPWPAGGGVNKFDKDHSINSTYNSSIATVLSNYKSTGEYATGYTTNATSITNNAQYCTSFTPCASGTTYTISNLTSGSNLALVGFVDDSGTVVSHNSSWSNQAWTHTADSTEKYIMVCAKVAELENVMIVEGSTMPASPSPYENLCPISGWDAVELRRSGVNVFKTTTTTFNGITYTANADGTVTLNGTSTGYGAVDVVTKLAAGTYRLFGTSKSSNIANLYIQLRNATSDAAIKTVAINSNGDTLTLTEETSVKCRILVDVAGRTFNNVTVYPVLCADSDIQQITIQLGETVYGGTLDVTNGTLTVDRAILLLRSNMPRYATQNLGNGYERIYYRFSILGLQQPAKGGLFSHGVYLENYTQESGHFYTTTTDFIVFLPTDGQIAAYLDAQEQAGHPVQICFPLATPIEIQLDPVTISTISGQTNNVWADAGDVSVEFAADLKHYIDSKIAAAVAALS